MASHEEMSSELCYLEAAHVSSPAGVLADFAVVTASGEPLGSIAGVVIEAAARRARYLDVRSHGLRRQRYLVPADQPAQVDSVRKQLRLLTDEAPQTHDPGSARFRPFSDEDLVAAVFASRAA